jgi:archaellum component FlaC
VPHLDVSQENQNKHTMSTEDEITKLKKRVYDLEQTIERILPLGDDLERRMKNLEDSRLPEPLPDVPPTQR